MAHGFSAQMICCRHIAGNIQVGQMSIWKFCINVHLHNCIFKQTRCANILFTLHTFTESHFISYNRTAIYALVLGSRKILCTVFFINWLHFFHDEWCRENFFFFFDGRSRELLSCFYSLFYSFNLIRKYSNVVFATKLYYVAEHSNV